MAVTVRRRDPLEDRIRENILLTGAYDNSNLVFYLPELAVHNPPKRQVKIVHCGRWVQPTEYEVLEIVPGSGLYNRIKLRFPPGPTSRLYGHYVTAV